MARLFDVGVLNTIVGAADAVISKGEVSLSATTETNNPGVGSISGVSYKDLLSYSKTAYSAGVASVKEVPYTGVPLTAGVQNTITITHNGVTNTFSVISAVAFASTAAIATALVAKINQASSNVDYTAAVQNTDEVHVTLSTSGIEFGDFDISSNTGGAVNVGTAFVAASGTAAQLNALSPNAAIAGGQYTKHSMIWNKLVSHNAVSGLKVYREVETLIFSEENAGAFAAFEAELDAILDGSKMVAVADVILYVGK